MRITLDSVDGTLSIAEEGDARRLPLYSQEAFELLSLQWMRVGWSLGHWRTFSWLGRQILQLPEDLVRLQEVVFSLRPDVIVETGVGQGGSAVFFAGLCRLAGRGRVVSVESRLAPEVRSEIAAHPLGDLVTLIEGDSASRPVVEAVARRIGPSDLVFVFLDGDHGRDHVRAELEAYAPLVSRGSYMVAADGVMALLADVPGGREAWKDDNPSRAAREFAAGRSDFVLDPPRPRFAGPGFVPALTYFPDAWLRRVS